MKLTIVVFAVLLCGCSTTWVNPSIRDPQQHADALTMDAASCGQFASGRAPAPIPPAQPSNYNVSGRVQVTDSTTGQTSYGTYRGTVRQTQDFSTGFAQGAAAGGALAAAMSQRRLKDACMRSLGWVDASSDAR